MKHSPAVLTAAALALVAAVATAPAAIADETRLEPTHAVARLAPGPADTTADLPAAPGLDLGRSVVRVQEGWTFFSEVNVARINYGMEPVIPNGQLSRLASDWALAQSEAGTYVIDDDLERKLPAGWSDARQVMHDTAARDAGAAVQELVDRFITGWVQSGERGITDVGIVLVEKSGSSSAKEYVLYAIAAEYPHSTARAGESTLYRFARPGTGTHFYSTSAAERNAIIGDEAFRYEGPVAYVLQPSAVLPATSPLHRFYRPSSGTHFSTSTPAEYARVLGLPEYTLDGVAGRVFVNGGSGRVPMYRFFRPASGTHFYTANAAEAEQVKAMPGYTFEGTAFFLRRAT